VLTVGPIRWEDTTNYGKGERGKSTPRAWTAKVGPITLTVWTHKTGRFGGGWTLRCRELKDLDDAALAAAIGEAAQIEALSRLMQYLVVTTAEVRDAILANHIPTKR
jgi:hypothetical protein